MLLYLREYSDKIAKDFRVQPKEEPSYFWSVVGPYLPSWGGAGQSIGQNLALTHGQEWSNKTIDFVVGKVFQEEVKKIPAWSWEALKHRVTGVAQGSLSEGLQLAITPKALPVLSVFCGVTGQIALPLLVSLVSFTYHRAMGNPEELKKLGSLPLEQLFSIDPETNRLRDAYGHLMTFQEMRVIFEGTAEYNLIGKLIEVCRAIDKNPDEGIEASAKASLKALVKTYLIKRSDGSVAFPDGSVRTAEEKQIIKKGLSVLAMKNYRHDKKEVRELVQLLARHSVAPFENLSLSDLYQSGDPKKMASLFAGEENEWKNNIIRSADGQYFVHMDCGDKKRGDIVPLEEMKTILQEADGIINQHVLALKTECEALIKDPSQQLALVEKLNQLDTPAVQNFLAQYVVQRQFDQALVNLDGTFIQDPHVFMKNFDAIPKRTQFKERAQVIGELVKQVSGHLPKDSDSQHVICCQDGRHILREDGSLIESDKANAFIVQMNNNEMVPQVNPRLKEIF